MLQLLAQSGVPCALVALGASLTNFQIKGQAPTLTSMLLLKLLVMPLIAWVLAFKVFGCRPLPPASSCCSPPCRPAPTPTFSR